MYSIFNSYLLKLTGTMAGLAFFSFALQAQEPVPADSVKAGQAEKVRMPYHVKGRVVDAVTGQGFAGARITTPNVNVSAMTDEKGEYEIGLPDLRVPLYVDAPGYSRQVVAVKGRTEVNVSLYTVPGHSYYDDEMSGVRLTGCGRWLYFLCVKHDGRYEFLIGRPDAYFCPFG